MRAILVNSEKNYIAYGNEQYQTKNTEGFDVAPHATIEVLIKSKGTESHGSTLYLWRYPCFECAKAIVYAGIRKVVYKHEDNSDPTRSEAQLLLEHSDIEIVKNPDLDF